MMKIAGTAMLTVSILLLGIKIYEKYKIRPKALNFFIELLTIYKFELKWSRKTIREIISNYQDASFKDYKSEVISLLNEQSLVNAFIENNNKFSALYLNESDELILRNFFIETGKGGLIAETALCDKTIDILTESKENAALNFKKLGPLTIKLSIICGIWLIIMLI